MVPRSASQWLSEHRGEVLDATPLVSTQGHVWHVVFHDRAPVIVKSGAASSIEREVCGLRTAAATGGVPRVLARPSAAVVILSWHPGESVVSPRTVRAAGAWLKRLHSLPCVCDDPLNLRDALLRRRDAWLGRASDELEVSTLEALGFDAFAALPRVACHRDFTPSNWLWDAQAGLTVVDFGQSRADARLWDLVKLEGTLFHEQPQLRREFYAAYGALGPEDQTRLEGLVLLHGLQTAVWGDTHGDADFSALGRAILLR